MDKLAFIQIPSDNEIHLQTELCCSILSNVLSSGFISIQEICCRVTSQLCRTVLTAKIYSLFHVPVGLSRIVPSLELSLILPLSVWISPLGLGLGREVCAFC